MRHSWTILALIALASCEPPRSKNPLSDPTTAARDARLDGDWRGRVNDKDEVVLHLVSKAGAEIDLVLVGRDKKDGAEVLAFAGFPSEVAGKSYLNLRAKTFVGDYGEKSRVADKWIFARYEIGKDGALTLFQMDEAPVKAAIAAGKLQGTVDGGNVDLTATSAQLAAWVAGNETSLWQKFGTFKRMK